MINKRKNNNCTVCKNSCYGYLCMNCVRQKRVSPTGKKSKLYKRYLCEASY